MIDKETFCITETIIVSVVLVMLLSFNRVNVPHFCTHSSIEPHQANLCLRAFRHGKF